MKGEGKEKRSGLEVGTCKWRGQGRDEGKEMEGGVWVDTLYQASTW